MPETSYSAVTSARSLEAASMFAAFRSNSVSVSSAAGPPGSLRTESIAALMWTA